MKSISHTQLSLIRTNTQACKDFTRNHLNVDQYKSFQIFFFFICGRSVTFMRLGQNLTTVCENCKPSTGLYIGELEIWRGKKKKVLILYLTLIIGSISFWPRIFKNDLVYTTLMNINIIYFSLFDFRLGFMFSIN